MSIPLVNLERMHVALNDEIEAAVKAAIERGDFILGSEVRAFEEEFAAYCETKHCVTVANGLDALTLALKGLGAHVATAMAVHQTGAMPVLVDYDPSTYNLDVRQLASAISSQTKGIIPVHLYGQPADMATIQAFAEEHNLLVIEDAAQAHGARYQGRRVGGVGRAGCFSFYPGKNLGAMGDGGAIVTNEDSLARWLREARNYGLRSKDNHAIRGWNSRLDNIQAAVLRVKLRYLDQWNETRRQLAEKYLELLTDSTVTLPEQREDVEHVWHLFVVRSKQRDALAKHLGELGIETGVHYPMPIHRQLAFSRRCIIPRPLRNAEKYAEQLLSLPLCPFLEQKEQETIAGEIREFQLVPTSAMA